MKIWWYINTHHRDTHFMKGRSGLFKLLAANTCFLTFLHYSSSWNDVCQVEDYKLSYTQAAYLQRQAAQVVHSEVMLQA